MPTLAIDKLKEMIECSIFVGNMNEYRYRDPRAH